MSVRQFIGDNLLGTIYWGQLCLGKFLDQAGWKPAVPVGNLVFSARTE